MLHLGLSLCHILCIMRQLHFSSFLKNLFLKTLEMRCLLVQLLCVLCPHFRITFLDYIVTYFCYVTSTLFICWKGHIFDDVRITLNYGNCWNTWIVCASYVIKWSFSSWSFMSQLTNFLIMLIFLIMLRSRL